MSEPTSGDVHVPSPDWRGRKPKKKDEIDKYDPAQPRDALGRWTDGGIVGAIEDEIASAAGLAVAESRAFSDQQRVELAGYKAGDYRQINNHVSGRASNSAYGASVKSIDSAFNKSKLKSDTDLWRGIQHPVFAANAEKLVGKSVPVSSFQSTSTDRKVAEGFAGFGKGSALLNIKAAKGSRAINMDQFESGSSKGESEILLPRTGSLKIIHVDRSGRIPVITGEWEDSINKAFTFDWGDASIKKSQKSRFLVPADEIDTWLDQADEDIEKMADISQRKLEPLDSKRSKTPFAYEGNVLGTLREDQVPRFFGALTDSQDLPAKTVKLSDLTAMQNRVETAKVKAIAENGAGSKLPVVIQHNGKKWIADGHHRLAAAWLNGEESAKVRFKNIEPELNTMKSAEDRIDARVAKIDESLGLVFGWAIVCKIDGEDYYDLNIDKDGTRVPEHITEDAMTKAALGLMEAGAPGNEMHAGPDVGHYPFVFPMTTEIAKAMGIETEKTGLMVAYKPTPAVLAKFRDGTYSGFSIEGRRVKSEMVA